MSITEETRRESYNEVLESLGKRQLDVYSELLTYGNKGATANELAYSMWQKGYFVTPERNRVHPRLNELVKDDLIFVKEKRECSITKRSCAVYMVKSN